MKQIILILSLTIAAFIAACSDSNTRVPLKSNGGNGAAAKVNALKKLEKASSDEGLLVLKVALEADKNTEIPDIIAAAKKQFDIKIAKDQPKKKKDKKQEKPKPETEVEVEAESKVEEDKITTPEEFESLNLITDGDVTKVGTSEDNLTKWICINTCDVQIVIKKKLNDDKSLAEVKAFVGAKISALEFEDNAAIQPEFLIASYDVSSNSANLRLITKDGAIDSNNYNYTTSNFPVMSYIAVDSADKIKGTGELRIIKRGKTKQISLVSTSKTIEVYITVAADYGWFGKNNSTSAVANPPAPNTSAIGPRE